LEPAPPAVFAVHVIVVGVLLMISSWVEAVIAARRHRVGQCLQRAITSGVWGFAAGVVRPEATGCRFPRHHVHADHRTIARSIPGCQDRAETIALT